MVSPKPKDGGNYISNEEALELINNIQLQGRKEIHDQKILSQFISTLSEFRNNIKTAKIYAEIVQNAMVYHIDQGQLKVS
jgi:hypothetical protein